MRGREEGGVGGGCEPHVHRFPGKSAADGGSDKAGRQGWASVASPELCQRKPRERGEKCRGGVEGRGDGRGGDAQARTIN